MKIVKIGNKEYRQMENIFDIGDERFVVFKQWLLQTFEHIDNASFLQMHTRIVKHFNSSEIYQIMVELENYKQALNLKQKDYDAYSICFALIHLSEGEQMGDTSTDIQAIKLKEMRKEGLTRGYIEETVENFMKASPKHFGYYLEMLDVMNSLQKEEVSNALQD